MLRAAFNISAALFGVAIAVATPVLAQATPDAASPTRVLSKACVTPEPMPSTRGINWYSDSRYSIIDPVLRLQHDQLEKPLTQFMDAVVLPADDAMLGNIDRDALACADRNLKNWAKAGGLTQKPQNRPSIADQTIAVFGLNVMAIKRREAGVPVSSQVQEWLNRITRNLVALYAQGGPRNNMYVWSGAAAAAGNLLQRDSLLEQHANLAWRTSIKKIDGSGVVSSEIGRGQRALVYHQYFSSALGALNLTRAAVGRPASRQDRTAMTRLAKAIGAWSCDATPLKHRTGFEQEGFSRWNRAMGYAFNSNYLTANWRRCTKDVPAFADSSYGGRFDLTASAILSVSAGK